MLHVESSRACEGKSGHYEIWAHHLHARRVAKFVRYVLPGTIQSVERLIGSQPLDDPALLIGLAETDSEQRRRTMRYGRPATTSLVRICDKPFHRDGAMTDFESARPEARARVLWTPEHPGRMPVHAKRVSIDDQGIGWAAAENPYHGMVSPLVSVPLTLLERQTFSRRLQTEVIEVLPSITFGNRMYAVLHPTESGEPLEQIRAVAETV